MKKFFVILAMLSFFSAPAAWAAKSEKDEVKPEFEYVELNPIMLPVITSKGPTQQLSLMIQLEIAYGKRSEIEAVAPRLIDAYLQDLYGALGSGVALTQAGVVNVAEIKRRLTDVTGKVMGEKKEDVRAVLLQVVQQRML